MVASARDRARAFSAARRHTWLVRSLRMLLPVLALACLGLYALSLVATASLKSKGIAAPSIKIDTKNLTMENPKYDGFGKDGAHYLVRAREAITDLKQTGPVRLNGITGDLKQTSGVVTNLKADWGTYDQKADVLQLHDNIEIAGTDGTRAKLEHATVELKQSRVTTTHPVWAQNETGTITAKAMLLNSKDRMAAFAKEVVMDLKPAKPPADASGDEAAKKAATPLPGLSANSGQPIRINAELLQVYDQKKIAYFRQNVVATQGDARLETPELDVVYEGKATLQANVVSQQGAARQPGEESKLKSVHARNGVVASNKDDRSQSETLDYDAANERALLKGKVVLRSGTERNVTGDVAEFDQKADTALVTGDEVVATQGRNVLRGRRLFVDRKTARTRLESPAGQRASGEKYAAGRIHALFYQNDAKTSSSKAAKKSGTAGEDAASPLSLTFKTDPNAPVEIDADTLDIFDTQKNAVFHGNVVAKQGDFVVRTVEMVAHYTGQTGLGAAPPAPAASKSSVPAAANGGAAQLNRVEAKQKVFITSKDGREVTGDWADFNVKANTVTVGGKVTIATGTATGGRGIIDGADEGSLLVIDLTTGLSHFETAPRTAAGKGAKPKTALSSASPAAVEGTAAKPALPVAECAPGLVCSTSRMRMVLYPKEVAAKAKTKIDEAAGSGTADTIVKKATDEAAKLKKKIKQKTESSSWEATAKDGAKTQ